MPMRPKPFILILLLLVTGSGVAADKVPFEERLDEARESVQDKEWPEAIRQYELLAKEAGNGPKGDLVHLELAAAYFSSGAMGKTVEVCDRFLAAHASSPQALQIQYLKAFALWSQGLFEESFSVFADRKWEELRALPEKQRPRIYDVIARALKGAEHGHAARVVRQEARAPLRTEKGFLLAGKLRDSVNRWESDETWDAFVAQAPAALRPKLMDEEKTAAVTEEKLRWGTVGLSFALDSATVKHSAVNYSQMFLNGRLDFDFNLSPSGSQSSLYAGYSLLPLSLPTSGLEYRWIDTGGLLRGVVVGDRGPGFIFILNAGIFFRVSQVQPASQVRLAYALGLDFYPTFRYRFPNGMSVGLYGKVSPFVQSMKRVDLASNLIAGGGLDFQIIAIPEKLWMDFFTETEMIRFKFEDGSSFENIHWRFGVKTKF